MTKRLTEQEHKLIHEMCRNNSDAKILVELNRIRRSLKITEVVTSAQVRTSRMNAGLHKTKGKHSRIRKDKRNEI